MGGSTGAVKESGTPPVAAPRAAKILLASAPGPW